MTLREGEDGCRGGSGLACVHDVGLSSAVYLRMPSLPMTSRYRSESQFFR
jgi:hypothetical protein